MSSPPPAVLQPGPKPSRVPSGRSKHTRRPWGSPSLLEGFVGARCGVGGLSVSNARGLATPGLWRAAPVCRPQLLWGQCSGLAGPRSSGELTPANAVSSPRCFCRFDLSDKDSFFDSKTRSTIVSIFRLRESRESLAGQRGGPRERERDGVSFQKNSPGGRGSNCLAEIIRIIKWRGLLGAQGTSQPRGGGGEDQQERGEGASRIPDPSVSLVFAPVPRTAFLPAGPWPPPLGESQLLTVTQPQAQRWPSP